MGKVNEDCDFDLVVREDASNNDNRSQNNSQVQVVIWWLLIGRRLEKRRIARHMTNCNPQATHLDTIGQKAEDSAQPKQKGKATKQILAEFHLFEFMRYVCTGGRLTHSGVVGGGVNLFGPSRTRFAFACNNFLATFLYLFSQ